ncbi:MAG: transcriptional regulator [Williamsia herbipolensis]|nr:transcriptional regulator [Williamsia herbipolensis]
MATTRTYDDSCGVAHALDLVGERWALLVIRELMLGPKRFTDLRSDLPGISANVLTHRLAELETVGVLTRRRLAPPAASWVYELTEWGSELEPALQVFGRWAARSPAHRKDLAFSATSLVLSLRTNFDATLAHGVRCEVALRCGDDSFLATVEDGVLTVDRVPPSGADAEIAGDPRMIASVVYGGRPLADATATGDLSVTGDMSVAERFLSLYSLPSVAEVA